MDGGDAAGGSLRLAELIDQHGDELLADFEEYYRPLPAMLREGRSPRYIAVLINQLPVESRTMAAFRGGPQFRGWSTDRYLTVNLLDALNVLVVLIARQNAKYPKGIAFPEPTPRPDDEVEKKERKKTNLFAVMAAQRLAARRKTRGD